MIVFFVSWMDRDISSMTICGVNPCSNLNTLTPWRINVLIANFKVSLDSFFFDGIEIFYQKNKVFARAKRSTFSDIGPLH
jgi:hypothetical protein